MRRGWRVILAAIPCLVLAVGCAQQEAIKYNNEIATITKELEAMGKGFGDQLQQNRGNPAGLQAAHQDVMRRADVVFKRGRGLTPPNTTEGKAMHEAFLSYLDTEEHIVKVEFGTLVTQLNNQGALQNTINRITQLENEKVGKLKGAQQNFAKANNIRLQ